MRDPFPKGNQAQTFSPCTLNTSVEASKGNSSGKPPFFKINTPKFLDVHNYLLYELSSFANSLKRVQTSASAFEQLLPLSLIIAYPVFLCYSP